MNKRIWFSDLNNGDLFSITSGGHVYSKTGQLTFELELDSSGATPENVKMTLRHDQILVFPITKVVFLKFIEGDIIAMFPSIVETIGCDSYQHHGQHSPASLELLEELTPATEQEYQSLKKELDWYYNLKVVTPESVL